MDRDGEGLLGAFLTHHVFVEGVLDLLGLGNVRALASGILLSVFLGDDVVAELDAFVADVHRGAGDQLADFLLALPAEGTRQVAVVVALLHDFSPEGAAAGPVGPLPDPPTGGRCVTT